MTDLREGVTATQHEVLNLIDAQAPAWADLHDWEDQLRLGKTRAAQAMRSSRLATKRNFAIEAAARLIDAADEIGRMIAAGDK